MTLGRNFVIYTHGRTGSSVIVDHLEDHPNIVCYNELFHPDGQEHWKNRAERYDRTDLMPYEVFKDEKSKATNSGKCEFFRRYLREMIKTAELDKSEASVGFKLLTYHANAHTRLMKVLKKRNFAFLHLIRRNVVRQVVSGFVANERGTWNERNWTPPSDKYTLDMTTFSKTVEYNQKTTERNHVLLQKLDVSCLNIYYEDYVEAPQPFLDAIHDFLGVEKFQVIPTDFSIMTNRNLRSVVANYDELMETTKVLGLEHMLKEP